MVFLCFLENVTIWIFVERTNRDFPEYNLRLCCWTIPLSCRHKKSQDASRIMTDIQKAFGSLLHWNSKITELWIEVVGLYRISILPLFRVPGNISFCACNLASTADAAHQHCAKLKNTTAAHCIVVLGKVKGKVPVRPMKAYGEWSIAPLVILGTRRRWVAIFTPSPVRTSGRTLS
jgi:hypothetical protein